MRRTCATAVAKSVRACPCHSSGADGLVGCVCALGGGLLLVHAGPAWVPYVSIYLPPHRAPVAALASALAPLPCPPHLLPPLPLRTPSRTLYQSIVVCVVSRVVSERGPAWPESHRRREL